MHASSHENMGRCVGSYLDGAFGDPLQPVTILDVGGADINGGYRGWFEDSRYRYLVADLTEGPGIDLVLTDPYRIPLEDGSINVVVSGQMLEHCEMFWLSFAEMMRVLRRDGLLFLIAPSSGPIHRFPVDCYRFYPDAYGALAKFAACTLVECWLDERGPWRDLVGVFSKTAIPAVVQPRIARLGGQSTDVSVASGTDEQEQVQGSMPYLDLLALIHKERQPQHYLEIGVRNGHSLELAQCPAIGIDPAPAIKTTKRPDAELVLLTSDEFFAGPRRELCSNCDLIFIDGMHLFEFALRDFMNAERYATADTIIIIDDIFPTHPAQANRTRCTKTWMGDVWKLHQCLQKLRPDLILLPVDTAPSGLLIVAGLDPANRALWEQYNQLVKSLGKEQSPGQSVLRREGAVEPNNRIIGDLARSMRHAQLLKDDRPTRRKMLRKLRSRVEEALTEKVT